MALDKYFNPSKLEQLDLKAGLVRARSIRRSEQYWRQYREWINSPIFSMNLEAIKDHYEQHFYFNSLSACEIVQSNDFEVIKFHNLTQLQSSHPFFVFDFLKLHLEKRQWSCFKSLQWRRLLPDEGLEVTQRYFMKRNLKWWQNFIPIGFIKSDVVVLEIKLLERQRSEHGILLFKEQGKTQMSVHKLMQVIFN